MAHINRLRARFAPYTEVIYPTVTTDVIEVGDLVVVSSNKAKPASSITATGGSAGTRLTAVQDGVADVLIGVAMSSKPSTSTPDIRVAVRGVFELSCAALQSAAHVGDAIEISGTDDATTGTATPQIVAIGATNPIGKLVKEAVIGDTTLMVELIGLHVKIPVVAD